MHLKNQVQYASGFKKCTNLISIGTLQLNTLDVIQQSCLVTFDHVPCFLLLIIVLKNGMEITVDALDDIGATISFINVNFVQKYDLPIKLTNMPIQVEVVDVESLN